MFIHWIDCIKYCFADERKKIKGKMSTLKIYIVYRPTEKNTKHPTILLCFDLIKWYLEFYHIVRYIVRSIFNLTMLLSTTFLFNHNEMILNEKTHSKI